MNKEVLNFLDKLKDNNNREWFQQHKNEYENAKAEVLAFVGALIPSIAQFDESIKYVAAKDTLFRIFKDIRFSKDKLPYKINMGAWISGQGRKAVGPGYYLHIQPGESFLAAGVYMPDPEKLKKIRQEIYYNVDEFKSILNAQGMRRYCNGLAEIDKAKLAPRDFPKDFPDIELLKHRHYTVSCDLSDEQLVSDKLHDHAIRAYKAMYPLNIFLRRALEE